MAKRKYKVKLYGKPIAEKMELHDAILLVQAFFEIRSFNGGVEIESEYDIIYAETCEVKKDGKEN